MALPRGDCSKGIAMPKEPFSSGAPNEFPTILVVGQDERLATLTEGLRFDGYLVLVAENYHDALSVVTVHSRQIHLLLVDGSMGASNLAAILKPFRLAIPVQHAIDPPSDTRARIRELVAPPKQLDQADQAAL
jgi:CheY-like chemotaxis protein